mgnify:CR=1 FL=1
MNCDICKEKIERSFLEKIKGSYIRVKGKLKIVCNDCQHKYKTKEELLKHL